MTATHTLTPVKPRVDFDQDVDKQLDNVDGSDFTGWYCIRTESFPCPANGCDFVATHMTAAHRILVWPEMDDPRLLKLAAAARDVHRNPRVIPYETGLGAAIAWDQFVAIGRPVHGSRQA